VQDVEDEPLFAERVAGIDIGKTVGRSWRREVAAKLSPRPGAGWAP